MNKKQIFIAGTPSQSGPYLRYDLDDIFSKKFMKPQRLWSASLPADSIIYSIAYANFLQFRKQKEAFSSAIEDHETWTDAEIEQFIELNPDHYMGYMLAGRYYDSVGEDIKAEHYLTEAFKRPIPWATDREKITLMLGGQ